MTEETQGGAPEALSDPQAAIPAPEAVVAPPPKPTPVSPPPEWATRRIDDLTRARREAEEGRDAATREVERLRAQLMTGAAQAPAPTVAAPRAFTADDVQRQAVEIAAEHAFQQELAGVNAKGVDAFPDWAQRLQQFSPLGGIARSAMEAMTELEDPHRVLYALAGDLNEAGRIMALPPARQAVALARFASKLPTPPAVVPAVSKAPAPVAPVVGGAARGDARVDDPTISMEEFVRLRQQQTKRRA